MNKEKKINIIIVFLFAIIFISQNNLFKKFFLLSKSNYEKRFLSNYQFCGGESIGFLREMKKKYSIRTNPKMYNYEVHPSSYWSIYNTSNPINESEIFFLNYPKDFSANFKSVKNNEFVNTENIQYSSGIDSLIFLTEGSSNINSEVLIYKKTYNKNEIIHSFKINELIFNNKKFTINLNTNDLNSTVDHIYIKFLNNENNLSKIKKIKLTLINKFDLDDYNLIDKYESCFYVRK